MNIDREVSDKAQWEPDPKSTLLGMDVWEHQVLNDRDAVGGSKRERRQRNMGYCRENEGSSREYSSARERFFCLDVFINLNGR